MWSQVKLIGPALGVASFVKLIVAPLLAYLICLAFPISPLLRNIIVIMTALPSAANTTIYAIQYNAEPDYVSACTFVSTILSFISLAFLLNLAVSIIGNPKGE